MWYHASCQRIGDLKYDYCQTQVAHGTVRNVTAQTTPDLSSFTAMTQDKTVYLPRHGHPHLQRKSISKIHQELPAL